MIFLNLFIILVLVIIQLAFLPHFAVFGYGPRFFLAVVLSFLLVSRRNEAFLYGCLGFLLLDWFSPDLRFGGQTIAIIAILLLTQLLLEKYLAVIPFIWAMLFYFCTGVIFYLLLMIFANAYSWQFIIGPLYLLILAPIFYLVYKRFITLEEKIEV